MQLKTFTHPIKSGTTVEIDDTFAEMLAIMEISPAQSLFLYLVLFSCDSCEERLVFARIGISKPYSEMKMSGV